MLDRSKVQLGKTKVRWLNVDNLESMKDDPRIGQVGTIEFVNVTNDDLYQVRYTLHPDTLPEGMLFNCHVRNLEIVEDVQIKPSITITHDNVKVLQVIIDKCSPMKGIEIEKNGF